MKIPAITKPVYRNVPAGLHKQAPTDIIFSGKPGTPFVAEIAEIEQKVEEIRVSISRYLTNWNQTAQTAAQHHDEHVEIRATNEVNGLYKLLRRLDRATQ